MRFSSGKNRPSWKIYLITGVILLAVLAVSIYFYTDMLGRYKNSVIKESSSHLNEIDVLLNSYIRQSVNNSCLILDAIDIYLQKTDYGSQQELVDLLKIEQSLWGIEGVNIYTDNAQVFSTNDALIKDDVSQMLNELDGKGKYVKISGNEITYYRSINSNVYVGEHEIVAISLTQVIRSIVNEVSIPAFNRDAKVFLCKRNGSIITQYLSESENTPDTMFEVIGKADIFTIDGSKVSYGEIMSRDDDTAYQCVYGNKRFYLIISPVDVLTERLLTAFFVPSESVNSTMNDFSKYITILCVVTIIVFISICMLAFVSFYIRSKRLMNKELINRNRLFDLISDNTTNGFALVNKGLNKPKYLSSSAVSTLGENVMYVNTETEKLSFVNPKGEITEVIAKINDMLEKWDEKSCFDSGYIKLIGDNYYKIRIYPTDVKGEYIIIGYDVTKDVAREEILKNALALAESANKAKSQFLSNISHDIRTPMNAIVNMTDFAIDSIDDSEKLHEYLDSIKISSEHLLELINNVLDMSRIDSGRVDIDNQNFNMNKCLNAIDDIITVLAEKKNQTYTVKRGIINEEVIGDHLKLTQILLNILGNAVKYTPKGGHILATVEEFDSIKEGTVSFRFIIKDDGIGVSVGDQQRIFDPFMRVKNDDLTNIKGTGLGLAITKGFVLAMGGTLHAESKLGEGTMFTVEMTFDKGKPAESMASISSARQDYTGIRVLFVDDDNMNRKIGSVIFKKLGVDIEFARDGKEAVDKFIASESGYYSVIFMDIQMPVMDGYQATRCIRTSDHRDAASIMIIALSANVFTEDVTHSHDAGMDGHVGKPMDSAKLYQILNQIKEKQRGI